MNVMKIFVTVLGYALFAFLISGILPMLGTGFLPWVVLIVLTGAWSTILFGIVDALFKNPNGPQNQNTLDEKKDFTSAAVRF